MSPAHAQDATWLATPGTGDFNTAANWDPATVPTGTAFFDTSEYHRPVVLGQHHVGGLTFNAGASAYTFTNDPRFPHSTAPASSSTAAAPPSPTATVVELPQRQHGRQRHHPNDFGVWTSATPARAGSATITNNNGFGQFYDSSTAGSAAITNNSF